MGIVDKLKELRKSGINTRSPQGPRAFPRPLRRQMRKLAADDGVDDGTRLELAGAPVIAGDRIDAAKFAVKEEEGSVILLSNRLAGKDPLHHLRRRLPTHAELGVETLPRLRRRDDTVPPQQEALDEGKCRTLEIVLQLQQALSGGDARTLHCGKKLAPQPLELNLPPVGEFRVRPRLADLVGGETSTDGGVI